MLAAQVGLSELRNFSVKGGGRLGNEKEERIREKAEPKKLTCQIFFCFTHAANNVVNVTGFGIEILREGIDCENRNEYLVSSFSVICHRPQGGTV